MIVWTLKKGADRRFRSGHPWVFSNELQASPKGIIAGSEVELRDSQGQFLARGYGHPNSLIAFRALTRDSSVSSALSTKFLAQTLRTCAELRRRTGYADVSHRLCFGEADGIPGLIIDRYVIASSTPTQVFVVQAHTSGAQAFLEFLSDALHDLGEQLGGISWDRTGIIIKNDVKMRELEGLQIEEPRVLKSVTDVDFDCCNILVRRAVATVTDAALQFRVELLSGQKTGFFLDQATNIHLLLTYAHSLSPSFTDRQRPLRILDLCCYVGQWGTQIAAHVLSTPQGETSAGVEVTFVDASARALEIAKENAERWGAQVILKKADVLQELKTLPAHHYDVVICDPPAFIKSRKEIPQGQHAYMKMNSDAMRLVVAGGYYVSCSCSGLLEEADFQDLLSKAARRSQRLIQWIARGSQAPDHPTRLEFPEGKYLKGWIGWTQG